MEIEYRETEAPSLQLRTEEQTQLSAEVAAYLASGKTIEVLKGCVSNVADVVKSKQPRYGGPIVDRKPPRPRKRNPKPITTGDKK